MMDQIETWLMANRMIFNATKTVSMLFGSSQKLKQKSLQLQLNGSPTIFVQNTKSLGLLQPELVDSR